MKLTYEATLREIGRVHSNYGIGPAELDFLIERKTPKEDQYDSDGYTMGFPCTEEQAKSVAPALFGKVKVTVTVEPL